MLIIKNGNLNTIEQEQPFVADILIKDGKIMEIGMINTTEDMQVIDAQGKNVYPGLIDAHSHLGIIESSIGYEGSDVNEMSSPVTPEVRALDGIYGLDEEVAEANAGGVTTVCVPPGSANVVGGQTVVFKTDGAYIDDTVLDPYVALKAALGENPKRVYKDKAIFTRMRNAQLLRNLLFEARIYKNNQEKGIDQKFDMGLEAVIPVLNKEIELKVHAHRADDILTAIRIGKEFDLNVTLDHCTDGHLIADKISASAYPALVGPTFTSKTKLELKNKSFTTPGVLQRAGVKVAIITDAPIVPQQYLAMSAGLAVKAGMDEYEALKAITINPAEILRLDNKIGSLKVGKDADIVIVDGNILDSRSDVLFTITNGIISYKK